MPDFVTPTLHHVFTARVTVSAPLELGDTPTGRRRVIPITGGTVEGPRLRGIVVPGGADWQVIAPDGTAHLVARYTLQAEDGTLISVVNSGIRHGSPEVLAQLAAGQMVDPSRYYFRATPSFEVAAGPHAWLTQRVFVATGERAPDHVVIRVFEVS